MMRRSEQEPCLLEPPRRSRSFVLLPTVMPPGVCLSAVCRSAATASLRCGLAICTARRVKAVHGGGAVGWGHARRSAAESLDRRARLAHPHGGSVGTRVLKGLTFDYT